MTYAKWQTPLASSASSAYGAAGRRGKLAGSFSRASLMPMFLNVSYPLTEQMMAETSAINPPCRTCGLPINDPSHIVWNGNHFHNDHVPKGEPAWPKHHVTDEMVLAFIKASDGEGLGAEKGSYLWEMTERGLRAALSCR